VSETCVDTDCTQNMIDYISMKVRHTHTPIPSGRVLAITSDGEIEWDTPKAMDISGSHDSKMRIRSMGELTDEYSSPSGCFGSGLATELYISGNPAKFLQGHNVFGCEDPIAIMRAVFERVNASIYIGQVTQSALDQSIVSRLDFTRSIQFDNEIEATAHIHQIGLRARTRNGRPDMGHKNTITFQKKSRRWSLVIYAKGKEIDAHPLPDKLDNIGFHYPGGKGRNDGKLHALARKLVRVELRLLGKELEKIGLRKLYKCTPDALGKIYQEYVGRIEMNTKVTLLSEQLISMKRCHRDTYFMWRTGADLTTLMSRVTLWRHRNAINRLGVDIFIPCEPEVTAEIIPLKRVISGQLFDVPSWAIESGLIFQPPKAA